MFDAALLQSGYAQQWVSAWAVAVAEQQTGHRLCWQTVEFDTCY